MSCRLLQPVSKRRKFTQDDREFVGGISDIVFDWLHGLYNICQGRFAIVPRPTLYRPNKLQKQLPSIFKHQTFQCNFPTVPLRGSPAWCLDVFVDCSHVSCSRSFGRPALWCIIAIGVREVGDLHPHVFDVPLYATIVLAVGALIIIFALSPSCWNGLPTRSLACNGRNLAVRIITIAIRSQWQSLVALHPFSELYMRPPEYNFMVK